MKRKLALIFVLFAVKAGLGAADPATGTVHGTVYTSGSSGEQLVVPGAHVKVSGPSSFDIQAEGTGSYSLSDVPPGVYSIEATAPGLMGSTVATIAAGETTETKVQLEIPGRAIDRGLVRGPVRAEDITVHRSVKASDHYPLSFTLSFD